MAFCLLDRNISIDIRAFLSGGKAKHLAIARAIDKRRNFVSPILSLIEGQKATCQTGVQMIDHLRQETLAIGSFFKHARVDSYFLNDRASEFVLAMLPENERNARYLPFVADVQKLLHNKVGPATALSVVGAIIDIAGRREVAATHPLAVTAISCAYGDEDARKVLIQGRPATDAEAEKFAYAALFDVLKLQQIAYIRFMLREGGHAEAVRLITADKGLGRWEKRLNLSVKKSPLLSQLSKESVEYELKLHPDLFPQMSGNALEGVEKLWDRLNIASSSIHLVH